MHLFGRREPTHSCRGCGCTENRPCPGGCAWVLLDIATPTGICSVCAEELMWDPGALVMLGLEEGDAA